MAASLTVSISALGWKPLDVTTAVRQWYETKDSRRERLRLLVDCSGCGDLVEANLFDSQRQIPFLIVNTEPVVNRSESLPYLETE